MPRFFADSSPVDGQLFLYGDDARHIGRSLRMRLGDEIILCHDKIDYTCKILKISDEAIHTEVLSQVPSCEPNIDLTLYMAMPKMDKLELVIQKAVELGANRIVPVLTSRCVARPDEKQFSKKLDRLQKISLEAAKQSGRGIIPEVRAIISLKAAIAEMASLDLALVLYENGGAHLGTFDYPIGGSVGVFVGSEGGFSPEEIEGCNGAGVKSVWLGNRILRCETAPITAISIIMHRTGNI